MRSMLLRSVGVAAFLLPATAFAQSTGSIDFEDDVIIVTGSVSRDVGGVIIPDTPKAKGVLTQDLIERQNPGQTILDTINTLPGVNFQNNDAYGSSGGTLNIRGFNSQRVSLTLDGVPLNDSGGYDIYSNQMIDPELIEQVNVNLGTTDMDSPTASATGGTVNVRTRAPNEDFGIHVSGSAGEFEFFRVFAAVDTGAFTSFGTRAFIAASRATNDNPFNNYGKVDKKQINGRIYQPLGSEGDFVSIAGHYNENRNNFFGSLPLRWDEGRTVGSGSGNRFPRNNDEREYDINYPCQVSTVARPGVADLTNGCGTEFDRRYNPSNTGNIRGSSRFTLSEGLVLTVDPSFQYVKANGGGTSNGRERLNNGLAGYMGGRPYFGMDMNGDGDLLDEVTVLTPSQTRTNRIGVISSLRYDINEFHTVRFAYTYDRARHRQTGQVGYLQANGEPVDVFPINDPIVDVNGTALQKRDRKSYAILNQFSAEYRGEFFDALTVNLGLRAPFFKRELNQYCFTTSANGFVDCFGKDSPVNDAYAAANPTVSPPQSRTYKYDKLLPNLGAIYDFTPNISAFASYAKGLSVPSTDQLYNSLFFGADVEGIKPVPETTDSFDLGLRYRSGTIQAQIAGWLTKYKDRVAEAYDPELDRSVFRNLGKVDKRGIDASVAWQAMPELQLYVFGSLNDSEIKSDLQTGPATFVATKGNRESGSASYSYGGTVRGTLGPVDVGVTAKRTGPRYLFDTNLPLVLGGVEVFPAKAPAYTLVNLDARLNLEFLGLNDKTFFQLNVYNLFDEFYVGGFGGGLQQSSSAPFVQIGAPRTISGTVTVAF
ncbi:TonB-dependent receptor [Sphingosinicella sp.]|uniref:TonB-dependent receptor n=1 Tax=Sphingosinicella sp. TaxID=1917971 RepID=UPI001801EA61|nr:TonB-dependent receptor [Sphingosinicella sp.]MBA4758794.1 TonB-dependent receptor [Sphingosinicella sp.]